MSKEDEQKIKFIRCNDGSIVFADDIVKFKEIDDNTTDIFIIL